MEKYLVKNALEAKNLYLIFSQYKEAEVWKREGTTFTQNEIILQRLRMETRYNTLLQVIAEFKGYTHADAVLFVKNYGVFND